MKTTTFFRMSKMPANLLIARILQLYLNVKKKKKKKSVFFLQNLLLRFIDLITAVWWDEHFDRISFLVKIT